MSQLLRIWLPSRLLLIAVILITLKLIHVTLCVRLVLRQRVLLELSRTLTYFMEAAHNTRTGGLHIPVLFMLVRLQLYAHA